MNKRSRYKCLMCGTILESTTRHDFKTCGCLNETFVDGGTDYVRVGGHDLSLIKPVDDCGNIIN